MSRILIVDDDPVVRNILSTVLGVHGHEVLALENGASCRELFQHTPDTAAVLPEIIFLDMFLPDTNGAEILRALKEDPQTENLIVILLTANSREEFLELSPNLEPDFFLQKPFTTQAVSEVLDQALARLSSRAIKK